jgi:hypothetical protein
MGISSSTPHKKRFLFISVVLLVVLLVVSAFVAGSLMSASVSVKTIVRSPNPPEAIWAIMAETDHQVFWRTNLINIIKTPEMRETSSSDKKEPVWKEIFRNNQERFFTISESVPGKHLVKNYLPDRMGQETITLIVLPDAGGSQIALIDTIEIRSPIEKLLTRFRPADENRLFRNYHEFASQLTNYLARHQLEIGGAAPANPATAPLR